MSKVIAIANQKGGVAKTTTVVSLGVALTKMGKRVLMVDLDPQANLTMCQGVNQPDELPCTIVDGLAAVMNDEIPFDCKPLIHKYDGVDFIPSDIRLSNLEVSMVTAMRREEILKVFLQGVRDDYDYILIDCLPSLQMLAINALTACDSVIIPVQSQYFSAKGLELLLQSIAKTKRRLNQQISIEGILITMCDIRTKMAREVMDTLQNTYSKDIRIFGSVIPYSIKPSEGQGQGKNIFAFDPRGKVAQAYEQFAKELIGDDR